MLFDASNVNSIMIGYTVYKIQVVCTWKVHTQLKLKAENK